MTAPDNAAPRWLHVHSGMMVPARTDAKDHEKFRLYVRAGDYDALCDALDEARAEIGRLQAALEPFANAPSHGLHGGPMVQAVLTYEDGSDENSARHKGRISARAFKEARATLAQVDR